MSNIHLIQLQNTKPDKDSQYNTLALYDEISSQIKNFQEFNRKITVISNEYYYIN